MISDNATAMVEVGETSARDGNEFQEAGFLTRHFYRSSPASQAKLAEYRLTVNKFSLMDLTKSPVRGFAYRI